MLIFSNLKGVECYFILGENTILVLTFWSYGQFGSYILIVVNLVHVIFNLQSIWFLPLTH